jgi:hypothetical protein
MRLLTCAPLGATSACLGAWLSRADHALHAPTSFAVLCEKREDFPDAKNNNGNFSRRSSLSFAPALIS